MSRNVEMEVSQTPKQILEVPRDDRGRISWAVLTKNPEDFRFFALQQAQQLLSENGTLNAEAFKKSRQSSLSVAVSKYYPGGLVQLKADLGVQTSAKPQGYWTPEKIEEEVRMFQNKHGKLNQHLLATNQRGDLVHAITRYYPGGLVALYERLGKEVSAKPRNYWNKEKVEKEARQLLAENELANIPSNADLLRLGRADLATAISRQYPGGMRQLRSELGLDQPQSPPGYWTPERIEIEVQQAMSELGIADIPSYSKLKEIDKSGLVHAISVKYPGGMAGLREKLTGRVLKRPTNYWSNLRLIEREANEFVESGHSLTGKSLNQAGMSSLNQAIYKYYPGGMTGLKRNLDLPVLRRPRSYMESPENIEAEAQEFYMREGDLSHSLLERKGNSYLRRAIMLYYPGKMRGLKSKLNIEQPEQRGGNQNQTANNRSGHRDGGHRWTVTINAKPAGYWTPEKVETEAVRLLESGERLSENALRKTKQFALLAAIHKHYPGGINALKTKLGQPVFVQRTKGHWQNPDLIEQEARDFYQQEGDLAIPLLDEKGRSDLRGAIITHYPGGMSGLKLKLGVEGPKPRGYWTPELIEQEAREFYEKEGELSGGILDKKGKSNLRGAIQHNYPGQWSALREKLGIEGNKPKGYWTSVRIEQAAIEFYQTNRRFDYIILSELKSKLANVVGYYPGGIRALREKLGISDSRGKVISIDPSEANEQLRNLLGGENE